MSKLRPCGVDLDLYQGEFVVLLGASGSGKSTLLNILGGLDTPSSGQIFYGDQELTAWTDAELTQYRRESCGLCVSVLQLDSQPDRSGKCGFDYGNFA